MRNNAIGSADAGPTRLERLALALLEEVKRHEAGRRLRNELEMEKFKCLLATPAEQPVGGPPWKP